MAQGARDLDLAQEELLGRGVELLAGKQDLERDRGTGPAVARAVHGTHAALAEQRLDVVRAHDPAAQSGVVGRRGRRGALERPPRPRRLARGRLRGDADDRRADPDLVAVAQVHLREAPGLRLLGRLVGPPAPVAHAVDVRAVEAAEVAQPRVRRVHLEEEVVPRRRRVARGEPRVAVGRAAEEERVVAREVEASPADRPGRDDEAHPAGHALRRIIAIGRRGDGPLLSSRARITGGRHEITGPARRHPGPRRRRMREPAREGDEQISQDEAILQKVNGAVNEVIRNSPDCDVAKPLIKEAYQRIDEARPQVTGPASSQTLEALKVQVDRVAQVCP